METSGCLVNCGGVPVHITFLHPGTAKYFRGCLMQESDCDAVACAGSEELHVQCTGDFLEENRWLVGCQDVPGEILEFHALMLAAGSRLLARRRAVFHGAAFCWRDLAWILTAPSGTGKTTQLVHWIHTQGRDVRTINGDKPILDCSSEGSVYVCSSPWRGKERYGHPHMRVELGGIIFLRQGSTNTIRRMEAEEAVPLLFAEFISSRESAEEIRQQADLLDRVMRTVPVWELVNVGDEESALLTQKAIGEYLQSRQDRKIWHLRQGVTLVTAAGVYLLAADRSAQRACDSVCRINETGALIWNMLQKGAALPAIVSAVQQQYQAADARAVEADVKNFIAALRRKGYITRDVIMPERSLY